MFRLKRESYAFLPDESDKGLRSTLPDLVIEQRLSLKVHRGVFPEEFWSASVHIFRTMRTGDGPDFRRGAVVDKNQAGVLRLLRSRLLYEPMEEMYGFDRLHGDGIAHLLLFVDSLVLILDQNLGPSLEFDEYGLRTDLRTREEDSIHASRGVVLDIIPDQVVEGDQPYVVNLLQILFEGR